jgi:hypothetical protein
MKVLAMLSLVPDAQETGNIASASHLCRRQWIAERQRPPVCRWLPVILAVAGTLLLLTGGVYMVAESRLSNAQIGEEIRLAIRELERQAAEPSPLPAVTPIPVEVGIMGLPVSRQDALIQVERALGLL